MHCHGNSMKKLRIAAVAFLTVLIICLCSISFFSDKISLHPPLIPILMGALVISGIGLPLCFALIIQELRKRR